jgi:hypothetical protein
LVTARDLVSGRYRFSGSVMSSGFVPFHYEDTYLAVCEHM